MSEFEITQPPTTPDSPSMVNLAANFAHRQIKVSSLRIFSNTELNDHRVNLKWKGYLCFYLTPRLAADAGITKDTRVNWGIEPDQRILALKVAPEGSRTPKIYTLAAGVLQITYHHSITPEPEILQRYLGSTDSPLASYSFNRSFDARVVPLPDGNEIHILPPDFPLPIAPPQKTDAETTQRVSPDPEGQREGDSPTPHPTRQATDIEAEPAEVGTAP